MTTYSDMAWDEKTEVVVRLTKDEARALVEAAVIAQGEGEWTELATAETRLRKELAE